jgi:hypothetical protein
VEFEAAAMKEKPIVKDRSWRLPKVLASLAQTNIPNPYESERHAAAVEYLKNRNIPVKALRKDG